MSLPQDLSEMRGGFEAAPGVAKQLELSDEERLEQMFPIEQGEKVETFFCDTGDLPISKTVSCTAPFQCRVETTHMM